MTTTSNTIGDQISEEPEIIDLIDDSDELQDNISQECLPNYMHADASQNYDINCIQLDDCEDDGINRNDIDLKPIDMNNSILSADGSQNFIIEEFKTSQSFNNLINSEINQQQQQNKLDSSVIDLLNKTDDLESINNQINLEKTNINLTSQQTDNNLNSSFNDSFTSINERVLHLESKLEINTETNQQQLNNELNYESNNESYNESKKESNIESNMEFNNELNYESDKQLNKEPENLMNSSLLNENAELGIIKIPGKAVPDCKYRTITLKILPLSQPTNQTTQTINSTNKKEKIVSPIKISTNKNSSINSTTKPTIQTLNPIQKINFKNENHLNKSEIKNEIKTEITNEIKNDNQINLSTNKTNIKSIKRPIDEVDKAILKISKKLCITEKCKNIAIDNLDWDSEYCSSKCLIKNCQEIFKKYVQRKKKESEDKGIVA